MPRGDVSEGVSHLSDAIVACGVIPLLGRLRQLGWKDRPAPTELLACFACFAADERSFGPSERFIMRELDIGCIADVAWWARVVATLSETETSAAFLADMADLHAKLRLVADTLPHLLPGPAPEIAEPGTGLVRVMLPPENGIPSHPLRLSGAIEAVCTLWNVACDLAGARVPLTLVSCNPAPDIAVTFRGAAVPMAELKDLIMQIWDRIVVSHSASLDDRIAIIPRSLPVLDRIGNASQAALAQRRDLEAGVRLFLEVGACIPEMDDPQRFTPARLMRVSGTLRGIGMFAQTAAPRAAAVEDDQTTPGQHERLLQPPPDQPVWISKIRAS